MNKREKIIKYYNDYILNKITALEISKKTDSHERYVYSVINDEFNKNDRDAPKFWNPEDEISPCVGHEFEG